MAPSVEADTGCAPDASAADRLRAKWESEAALRAEFGNEFDRWRAYVKRKGDFTILNGGKS